MNILLTEDVVGLGDIGETVKVKAGYARNFLIPRGKAMEVGAVGAKEAQHRARQLEAKKNHLKGGAEKLAQKISEQEVVLELRVGSGGKVFGSIQSKDIAKGLVELGHEIDRRRVLLQEPIKKIGTESVQVKLHSDVIAELKVTVKALAATAEQEAQEVKHAKAKVEENFAGLTDEEVEVVEGDEEA